MKKSKVSVTDKYTYDGKEMSEREVKIYLYAKSNQMYHIVGCSAISMIFGFGVFAIIEIVLNH